VAVKLPLLSTTPVVNLQPVLLIPVVHLELLISLRIFEKIINGANRQSRAREKLIHDKNLVTFSIKHC
jgi:hypothetical protein